MSKSSFCWVQRHIFHPNPRFPSPSKLAKTENPGTSSALKSGYPEEYRALKTGYPEEHVTLKSGYRKRLLHWKLATGRGCYIENWLPGKETKSNSSNILWERIYLLWNNKHSMTVRQGDKKGSSIHSFLRTMSKSWISYVIIPGLSPFFCYGSNPHLIHQLI